MTNVPEETMMNWTSLQNTITGTKKRAMRALMAEYTSLLKEPAEGFVVKVDDPFNWDVGIYGPPSTPYWGGYFKVHVSFPDEYPFEPPKLKFKCRFWHPNVYHNGSVCMSILHDPQAEEIPTDLPREEKWNPTLSVRTVLLSLISIMGSPNPDSPANPEASKMYRSWLEDGDQDYVKLIEDTVKRSKKTAIRDGVTVPKTLEEYLKKPKPKVNEPLVSYSSDEDSSDHSELLSLPSSQESDHEDFFDAESNWITVNSDVISVEKTNRAAFSQEESFPSLSSHYRNNLGRNQIHEEYFKIGSQNARGSNESQSIEPNGTVESNISTLLGVEFDPKLSSREVDETSTSARSQTSIVTDQAGISLNAQGTSSSGVIDRTTSTNVDNNKLFSSKGIEQPSLSIGVHQTCLLRPGFEQISSTYRAQSSSLEAIDNTTTPLDITYPFLSRRIDQTTSYGNIESSREQSSTSNTNDVSTDQAARTATVSRPPISNRKRRRPPRLYLFSQINDIKKRKRQ